MQARRHLSPEERHVGTHRRTGTLTLDGQGNTDAEFIFQAGSTLITASNSRVLYVNGADPCHVVWQVGIPAVPRNPDRPGGPGTPGTPDSGTPYSSPPWLAYTGLDAERLVSAAVVLLLLGALARGLALGSRRRSAAHTAHTALG